MLGPLVGCVLWVQASLGGALTVDLHWERDQCSSAWPEDGEGMAEEGTVVLGG